MDLTLAIPIYGMLHHSKGALGNLKMVTSEDVEWLIIDNGSQPPIEEFFIKYLKPRRVRVVRNEENIGLVKTYQQIFDLCETKYLMILHDDVYIYERYWDKRVVGIFNEIDDLGMVGFFGASGCGPMGERIQDIEVGGGNNMMAGVSNMLEAEKHGTRLEGRYKAVAIFDGFALGFRMEMVKKSGGIDKRYKLHHLYDRELGLVSLALGYKNVVLGVSCHHTTGLTTGNAIYGDWLKKVFKREFGKEPMDVGAMDKHIHDSNTAIFMEKWRDVLPLYIEEDFSFRQGWHGFWEFKGDAIRRWKGGEKR